jgi:hypothetical protein
MRNSSSRSMVSSPWRGFGDDLVRFVSTWSVSGCGTAAIGLPATTWSATRKVKYWLHVDQARAMDDSTWVLENSAKA